MRPPVTAGCEADEEVFTQNTHVVSYSEEMHHIYSAEAFAKIRRNTRSRQKCGSVDEIRNRNKQYLLDHLKYGFSTSFIDNYEFLLASDSDSEPVNMDQLPKEKLELQHNGAGVSEELGSNKDQTSSKDPSSPASGSVAEKIKDLTDIMANESSSSDAAGIDESDIGTPIGFKTPPMVQGAIPTDIEHHVEPVLHPTAQGQASTLSGGSPEMFTDAGHQWAPVAPERSKLRGGKASVTRSPFNRSFQAFAPSPLKHVHRVASPSVGSSGEGGSPLVETPENHDLLENKDLADPLDKTAISSQPLAHGPQTSFETVDRSFAHPSSSVHDQGRVPSSDSQTKSERDLTNMEETKEPSDSIIAGSQPLHRDTVGPSTNSQTGVSARLNKDGGVKQVSAKITVASEPLGQVSALSASPFAHPQRSRSGPPINLYDQTILKLVEATPSETTPPAPTSISPISPGPSSSRPRKRAKRGETAGEEDPFENFTSGSEIDDETDDDFNSGGGAASPSPSVEELSRAPTPMDDDDSDDCRVTKVTTKQQQQQASSDKGKAKAPLNRIEKREVTAGALTVWQGKKKPEGARRGRATGYWPTASQAFKGEAEKKSSRGQGTGTGLGTSSAGATDTGTGTGTGRSAGGRGYLWDQVDLTNWGDDDGGEEVQGSGQARPEQTIARRGTGTGTGTGTLQLQPRVPRIERTGRDGAGWTLHVDMVRGVRRVTWKLES
ncbi:MAG: hypothetical protein LQ338_003394 [Usnochroma carphineum]|nr:MAG: hypothetical protein LQ338_003394 [Usnochroma carphineum]